MLKKTSVTLYWKIYVQFALYFLSSLWSGFVRVFSFYNLHKWDSQNAAIQFIFKYLISTREIYIFLSGRKKKFFKHYHSTRFFLTVAQNFSTILICFSYKTHLFFNCEMCLQFSMYLSWKYIPELDDRIPKSYKIHIDI